MKKSWIIAVALLALSVCEAVAQSSKADRKERKEAAVGKARKVVADDKYDLNTLRAKKADDKYNFDRQGMRADRKAIRKTDVRLMKDRAKRDVAKVKKAL